MRLTSDYDYLTVTKSGKSAIWEAGGGCRNTGYTQVVCDQRGLPMKPIYIARKGHLSNSCHALFVLREGMYVVKCDRHHSDYTLRVLRVAKINVTDYFADCEVVVEAHSIEDVPEMFKAAAKAALRKSSIYHCREAVYILE
jgi:hypothetical protein